MPVEPPIRLETLFTAEQIAAKTHELANLIRADYGSEQIVLLGVLKGSFHFLSDLSRLLADITEIEIRRCNSAVDVDDVLECLRCA